MESVEVLDGLSIGWKGEFQIRYYSMHNFRQVASLLSQTSYGTATGKGEYGVYLKGLLECRENHFLMCLKSGNPNEKEVSGRSR